VSEENDDRQFRVAFYNQWRPLYDRSVGWNWIDFEFFRLGFERAYYAGRWEISITVLGLCFVFTWVELAWLEEMHAATAKLKRRKKK
jgi:hypothetical protein